MNLNECHLLNESYRNDEKEIQQNGISYGNYTQKYIYKTKIRKKKRKVRMIINLCRLFF